MSLRARGIRSPIPIWCKITEFFRPDPDVCVRCRHIDSLHRSRVVHPAWAADPPGVERPCILAEARPIYWADGDQVRVIDGCGCPNFAEPAPWYLRAATDTRWSGWALWTLLALILIARWLDAASWVIGVLGGLLMAVGVAITAVLVLVLKAGWKS